MLIMPILNKGKDGKNRIYNVEIKLKNASKVKEGVVIKGYKEGDIMINGTSFNGSIYDTKNKEPNATVNFLRNYNYRTGKRDFLVTTRENAYSTLYDLYNVMMPPRKVTAGLDNLYGSAILDMKNEIPGVKKGRYVSLKKLGIDKHITKDKLEKLEEIVSTEKDEERRYNLMQLRGVSDLAKTIEYMNHFDCTIISEATIAEEELKEVLNIFSFLNTKDTKNLSKYYEIASDNKEIYSKLTQISKILYNKPINLIKSGKKQKVKIKTIDEGQNQNAA